LTKLSTRILTHQLRSWTATFVMWFEIHITARIGHWPRMRWFTVPAFSRKTALEYALRNICIWDSIIFTKKCLKFDSIERTSSEVRQDSYMTWSPGWGMFFWTDITLSTDTSIMTKIGTNWQVCLKAEIGLSWMKVTKYQAHWRSWPFPNDSDRKHRNYFCEIRLAYSEHAANCSISLCLRGAIGHICSEGIK
jgi:hypothetical protein